MVMASDITERKRIDQMKTEFVSTVSHELRTPLTSISGSLGLVASGVAGPLPERAQGMLAIAHKNSQRLSRLIDDLLDMEKLVEGKVRLDMSICELMPHHRPRHRGQPVLRRPLRRRHRCTARDGQLLVDVDPLRLHQVLSNLLSNAAKFSEPRTAVEIAVARTATTPCAWRSPTTAAASPRPSSPTSSRSSPRPTPPTAASAAVPAWAWPSRRSSSSAWAGPIGFTSVEGAGIDVLLRAARGHPRLRLEEEPVSELRTILYVEDDPDIQEVVTMALEVVGGYEVSVAASGREALDRRGAAASRT